MREGPTHGGQLLETKLVRTEDGKFGCDRGVEELQRGIRETGGECQRGLLSAQCRRTSLGNGKF